MNLRAWLSTVAYILTTITVRTHGATFDVGSNPGLPNIGAVPWPSLQPGDQVLIHWRPEPYRERWVITQPGTAESPILVRGIAGPEGQLPVIDGRGAVSTGSWPGENRAVIKIGASETSRPASPSYITLEDLEVCGARPPFTFQSGKDAALYLSYAAGIWIEKGSDITIRHCVLRDCANGLLSSHESSRILVEKCRIYDNGIEGDTLEHNSYTESSGIVFQFNRIGPLRTGCFGNALKDRSSDTVIRYNWIQGGSRMLDLVDSDYAHLREDPAYSKSYVYGNILIMDQSGANNQVVHYGGDSGKEEQYRRGTLYFYHNTVATYRRGNTVLFRLSSAAESALVLNNVFCGVAGTRIGLLAGPGRLRLADNWLPEGWKTSFETIAAQALETGPVLTGAAPCLADLPHDNFRLAPSSAPVGAGKPLPAAIQRAHPVEFEYREHQNAVARPPADHPDLGAFKMPLVNPGKTKR